MLMKKTGISAKQIKYWFVNARRRFWKQNFLENQKQEQNSPAIFLKVKNDAPRLNDKNKANTHFSKLLMTPRICKVRNQSVLNKTLIPFIPQLLHQRMLLQRLATNVPQIPATIKSNAPRATLIRSAEHATMLQNCNRTSQFSRLNLQYNITYRCLAKLV